jgi:anthranilate 3-monooxygenase (FAD)/4-hydroxyphenylacetate 3-monooxygenase
MPARTGKQYIESLSKMTSRACIYLNGRRVKDVTKEPFFQGPIAAIAEQYDMQHDPRYKDILTYPSPKTGLPVSTACLIPQSKEELVKKRQSYKLHTDQNFGFMGRASHFMLSLVTGWHLGRENFARSGQEFADNATWYYEYVRDNDLFLTHVLVNPQIDRSKASSEQEEPFIHLGKVRETDEGIIVRGAKMLGTMGPLTEELVVVPFGGIAPGDHEYALTISIPLDAPGLKLVCREPFGHPNQPFDHPLSSRFEEIDCFAIFDDVLVPWRRVIVPGRPGSEDIINHASAQAMAGQAGVQTTAQMLSQMELCVGIAMKMADSIGITGFLHVQEKLGEMVLMLELCRTAYYGSEALAQESSTGMWLPGGMGLRAFRLLGIQMYERMLEIIRILAGGGFFQTPTEADMNNPEIRPYIDKFMRGRPGFSAEERLKIFKLAWDVSGTDFGIRAQQYVHFHGGDPIRLTAAAYLNYNKDPLLEIVDRALGSGASIPISPVNYPDEPLAKPSGQTLHAYPAIGVPHRTQPRQEEPADPAPSPTTAPGRGKGRRRR